MIVKAAVEDCGKSDARAVMCIVAERDRFARPFEINGVLIE